MRLLTNRYIRALSVAVLPLLVFGFADETVRARFNGNSVSIIAGHGVGSLQLGDSRERASELFPIKKDVDQEYAQAEGCGTELNWVDLTDPRHVGNIFIHFRVGAVFQIDVADRSFRTPDGISLSSSPELIRERHPKITAWVLSDVTSEAQGDRPLVYWIDREQGIAFSFAYSKSERRRSLYEIIVFTPGSDICAHDDSTNAKARRKLAPFSLEP